MKRVLTIFSAVLFLISCGNNDNTKDKTIIKADKKNADVARGLELVSGSDCFTCHKLTESSIGPAYADIAVKYKTLDQPAMDSMVDQIINGGAGRWGPVLMTPHPAIPKEDAQLMVHYIMSIKK